MHTDNLDQLITTLHAQSGAQFSFVIRDVQSGQEIAFNPDRVVPTASVYKLPILLHIACAVHEGSLDWNTRLVLTVQHISPGTGVLRGLTPGLSLSVHDACYLMIVLSDNTATDMLIEYVSIEAINRRLKSFGFQQTQLLHQAQLPQPLLRPYATGRTTPREMAQLLTHLVQNTLGYPAATRDMYALLAAQQDHTMIARHLPPGWSYAGKPGADPDLRADVGIVTAPDGRQYVCALFCHDLPAIDWSVDNPGACALAKLAYHALVTMPSAVQ